MANDLPVSKRKTSAPASGHAGFTLVELMLTVAILGILLGIALPNFTEMIQNQKIRSATSDLFGALIYARSEAVKRNSSVNVVSSDTEWQSGWTVETAGGTVLKRQDPYAPLTISGPAGGSITFGSNGRPSAASAGAAFMVYSTARPAGPARCITLGLSGMPSISVDTDTDKTNGC
jgi:type IV fimbrial biogenesis protein FimT